MSLASIRTVASAPTAVLRLSPERRGISGSAQLPSGEPVPIADLLTRVLAQYGLPETAADDCQTRDSASQGVRFNVLA